ncbi:right-handed parallel beta-helix repeat-containing protein [Methanobacterium alcaliphilum]|uniref:right-handed parallel beta-helix repeat-containing protein n=1 Tax=Methanobacterium alcaliphilum TaxID=392018 RepID=UPI00200BA085|nr:right-handed parallel beta-helix repeat-containing protein [Methanobacterium alcaliphilum]MCK9150750.1 right-handed parallel beta-helix repeat-containing protein [Methanobacterium alcaliphilum]
MKSKLFSLIIMFIFVFSVVTPVVNGLEKIDGSKWRMEINKTNSTNKTINDTSKNSTFNNTTKNQTDDLNKMKLYVDSINGNDSNDGIDPTNPKKTIKSALRSSPENGTIILSANCDFKENGIYIDKNVQIISQGSAIDAEGNGRAIEIAGDKNVNITGVKIINANVLSPRDGGAGIYINNGAEVIIDNCNFNNDIAGLDFDPIIENPRMSINSIYPSGGAIYNNGAKSLIIKNSHFQHNKAYYGAAIYNYGNTKIENCNFENNLLLESYVGWNAGGAIYADGNYKLEISDCVFKGSKIKYSVNSQTIMSGGVIYNNYCTIDLKRCIFSENDADKGGAIKNNHGTLHINGTTFKSSKAYWSGGAIDNDGGKVNIDYSTFLDNRASNSYRRPVLYMVEAGAIYNHYGELKVNNSIFNGNYGQINGGAIVSYYGDEYFENTNFTRNQMTWKDYYGKGGAIYHLYNNLTIKNCYFGGNYAAGAGGAIYTIDALVIMDKTRFLWNGQDSIDNVILQRGGAIYIEGAKQAFNITNSQFDYNRAEAGGALYSTDANLIIVNSSLTNNYAEGIGGAIFIKNIISKKIYGTVFKANYNGRGEEDNIYNMDNMGKDIPNYYNNLLKLK